MHRGHWETGCAHWGAGTDLRDLNLNSAGLLLISKPSVKVVPGFSFKVIAVFVPVVCNTSYLDRGGGIDNGINSRIDDCSGINWQGDRRRKCHSGMECCNKVL